MKVVFTILFDGQLLFIVGVEALACLVFYVGINVFKDFACCVCIFTLEAQLIFQIKVGVYAGCLYLNRHSFFLVKHCS